MSLLCLAPANAHAAWPSDTTVNVPLCTAAGNQNNPTIASDGASGAIVTWYDYRSGTNYDIYAQRVNAAGVPQWTANGVGLCTAAGDQAHPAITSDGAGGAIVAWEDQRNGTNTDIYAQRVNAAGVPQWTANGVALCTAVNVQDTLTIASDGAGGAIVTWEDFRNGTDSDIYAQRVNADGVPQWTANGVALCTAANAQQVPTIALDGAGGAIVTWQDRRSGTDSDIYAQRVNADGVPQWTANGVALCTAHNDQYIPTIASDGVGGAIVTWEDSRSGFELDIYAQRVNNAGVPQWTANGVALGGGGNSYHPTISSDGAAGAIVTWEALRNGIDYDIYAQRVDAAGVTQWTGNGVALCTATDYQYRPTIASDGAGGAIVTWFDYRSGTSYDIYAQGVNAAGVPKWTANGVALSTAVNNQLNPMVISNGAGGAIVTWEDDRNETVDPFNPHNWDIYAQNVNSDGSLGGTVAAVAPSQVAAGFALSRVEPNPSVGDLRVSFSLLDDTPASLEVYDLMGRVIESKQLGSLGAGVHVASLGSRESRWPPGIYGVRLAQGGHIAYRKVAIVR